ncbi:MAG: GNAT family N-acetyltransferase [Spirochaetaceae bacterium]|nr:GNAT family N-acetyltransferase [Spirochaetaceae bacterium]MCL2705409.1 GNAT family N-acetyltransferase [Spirochaetaceae bacterium]
MEKLINIRKCKKDDADSVFEIICQLEGENPDVGDFNRVFLTNLENPEVHYIIAEFNSQIIGFASMHIQNLLHHTGKIAEIQELFIDPSHRNRGFGEELLWHLRDIAGSENCKHLEISCNIVRDKANLFFSNRGLNPTHRKFTERL